MTAQFGPHRWSAGEHAGDHIDTDFTVADLTGTRFLDCDMSHVKVIDSWLVDVDVSGYVDHFVVNGVDVTAYVNAELDRRHPERVQLRNIRSADDFRSMWGTVERLWSDTVTRAEQLPEPMRHERVDGEWSFVETLRHLVFIADAWASRTVLDEPMPYHRLGVTQTAYARSDAAALGIDHDARPSYAEVMEVRADRMALVHRVVDGLSDADLGRPCSREPAPGYPQESRVVGECLGVVMEEECEHHRYTVRDLAVLESRQSSTPDPDDSPVIERVFE
jgi:DinB superfamily